MGRIKEYFIDDTIRDIKRFEEKYIEDTVKDINTIFRKLDVKRGNEE